MLMDRSQSRGCQIMCFLCKVSKDLPCIVLVVFTRAKQVSQVKDIDTFEGRPHAACRHRRDGRHLYQLRRPGRLGTLSCLRLITPMPSSRSRTRARGAPAGLASWPASPPWLVTSRAWTMALPTPPPVSPLPMCVHPAKYWFVSSLYLATSHPRHFVQIRMVDGNAGAQA